MHLVAAFAGHRFSSLWLEQARAAGVILYPVEEHAFHKGRHEDKVDLDRFFETGIPSIGNIDNRFGMPRIDIHETDTEQRQPDK